jgi:hypothetical protein
VLLRTRSHRARNKLASAIGRRPQYLYTLKDGGVFAEVTDEEYLRVRGIRGITAARVLRENVYTCW